MNRQLNQAIPSQGGRVSRNNSTVNMLNRKHTLETVANSRTIGQTTSLSATSKTPAPASVNEQKRRRTHYSSTTACSRGKDVKLIPRIQEEVVEKTKSFRSQKNQATTAAKNRRPVMPSIRQVRPMDLSAIQESNDGGSNHCQSTRHHQESSIDSRAADCQTLQAFANQPATISSAKKMMRMHQALSDSQFLMMNRLVVNNQTETMDLLKLVVDELCVLKDHQLSLVDQLEQEKKTNRQLHVQMADVLARLRVVEAVQFQ